MAISSKPLSKDDQAFMEELFITYQRLIYAAAKRTCGNPNLWDDIVQESVLRLCRYVKRLRPLAEQELAAYISVTVRHTAIDLFREEAVRQEHTVDWREAERIMIDRGPTPEEFLELMERKISLREIWPDLAAEEQWVLHAWYWGLSDREQAEQLGCQADAVRVKRSRARHKALRLMLEAEGGDPSGAPKRKGVDRPKGDPALGAV